MQKDTKLIHLGSDPARNNGAINPPVMRASTMVFPTLAALDGIEPVPHEYGIYGTDTANALKEALVGLEEGYAAELVPSGLAAISTPMLAYLEAGDHLLVTENAYFPTRRFCDFSLKAFNIEVTYFNPDIGNDISHLIKQNTRLIWLESPGSLTFEMHDVPAITAVAKKHGIVTIMDNTWGAGYFYKPLKHGVDVSIQAGTKYIGGHSDLLLGTIVCANKESYEKIHRAYCFLGLCVSPDDIYLALRGLRTMAVRLRHHEKAAMLVADYLAELPEVVHIMHPGREGDIYHDLWKRDFTGSCGLFGFVMKCSDRAALAAMVDNMGLFRMGYSWGGFESLILPTDPNAERSSTAVGRGLEGDGDRLRLRRWDWLPEDGYQTMRLHIGLEAVEDLIADLQKGFERMKNA